MDVLIITLVASLAIVVVAVLLLVRSARQGDFEHGDRLSLLPLAEDERPTFIRHVAANRCSPKTLGCHRCSGGCQSAASKAFSPAFHHSPGRE